MFENLRHLLPGQSLRVSREHLEISTWWDWHLPDEWRHDEVNLAQALAERMECSVQRMLGAERKSVV